MVDELVRLVVAFGRILTTVWRYRRWGYAAYMVNAVLRIPSRTGFYLRAPACNLQLTAENFAASLTKVSCAERSKRSTGDRDVEGFECSVTVNQAAQSVTGRSNSSRIHPYAPQSRSTLGNL